MSNESQQRQAAYDASHNRGPKAPTEFNSAAERNAYNAEYNRVKQQQNQK